MKKTIVVGMIVCSLLLLIISPTNAWWNNDWDKKVAIHIDNTGGSAQTYYQIKLNITYDSDMQSDFDDIRFVNVTSDTTEPYWIEDKVDSSWCLVWFNATYIKSEGWSNDTTEMYYDNAGATSESNGSDTFLKYDGFEDGVTTDAGDLFVTPSNKVSNEQARSGTYSMKILGDWVANGESTQSVSLGEKTFGSISIIRWIYLTETTGSQTTVYVLDSGAGETNIGPYVKFDGGKIYAYNGASWIDTGFTFTVGWHRVEIIVQSSSTFDLKVNDDAWVTGLSMYHTLLHIDIIGEHRWGTADVDSYRDDYCVRKYTSPEPSVYLGNEESQSTPTPTPTSTPTSSGEISYGDDLTFTTSALTPFEEKDFGKNYEELKESKFNISTLAVVLPKTYTDMMLRSNIFFGLFFGLIFMAMWIRQEDVVLPALLGMVIGASIFIFLPAEWMKLAQSLFVISLSAGTYSLIKGRK